MSALGPLYSTIHNIYNQSIYILSPEHRYRGIYWRNIINPPPPRPDFLFHLTFIINLNSSNFHLVILPITFHSSYFHLLLILLPSSTHPTPIFYSSYFHLLLILLSSSTHPTSIFHSSYFHLPLILLPSSTHPTSIFHLSYSHLPLILLPSSTHPTSIFHSSYSHLPRNLLIFLTCITQDSKVHSEIKNSNNSIPISYIHIKPTLVTYNN